MRISPPRQISSARTSPPRPGATLALLAFALAAAFLLGFLTRDQSWHAAALRWGRDPRVAFAAWRARATLPTLTLDMRFADVQRLAVLRERALQLGVHVPFADETVSASVIFGDGRRGNVDARLPGGPAVLMAGESWPLELRVTGAADWLRLTPVEVIGPEAAWQQLAHLAALRREGFAAATQSLVRVQLNGRDWGLYILETPASAELLLAFDPQPAWAALAAGQPLSEGGFRYADVALIAGADSPAASAALADLRALQIGAAALSAHTDPDVLGRFFALTALWLGDPAPDWRALRWAYDPVTQQLAPVGAGVPWTAIAPLPEAFLADPAVQTAYARALVELSTPAYLEQLRREQGASLETLWLALGGEGSPWPLLEAHQRVMRARLAPERAVTAILEREGADFVLRLVNLQPFPVQIAGLDAGGAGVRALDPAWVLPEDRALLVEAGDALVLRAARGALPQPVRMRLPWTLTTAGGDALTLAARLWDAPAPELRIPVTEFEAAP